MTVADVEYSWNTRHEDLAKLRAPGAVIANGTPEDPFGDTDHGTAVAGMLGATADAVGVTGLVPDAGLKVVNTNGTAGYNPANAIDLARRALRPGDVILVEQQTTGVDGRYVPLEWALDVYGAIRTATAAGIVVVEAAGNGSANLDDPAYAAAFGPGGRDSGAIIVGAGSEGLVTVPDCVAYSAWPARSPLPFSTYGSRVDVQGWGGCVLTTGYGDVNHAGGVNRWYTAAFSGTSSASPMVAAAAAALSGAYRAKFGRPPAPARVRAWLTGSGTPMQRAPYTFGGRIGPLPDLRRAFTAAGLGVPSASAPGTPARTAASAGADTVTVTWQAPSSVGGTAVAGYHVTRDGRDAAGGGPLTNSYGAAARSATFGHLASGTTYRLTVRAVNSGGASGAASVTVRTGRAAVPGSIAIKQ